VFSVGDMDRIFVFDGNRWAWSTENWINNKATQKIGMNYTGIWGTSPPTTVYAVGGSAIFKYLPD
jgi:hypothetical protein